ncbi:cytoplasmic protein [Jeotgalibacillus malaysiensis]|uniref:cytoplasmic protein n=1 Tax=Jeotgalibacillus malaysiensis TaxID=1508404 RepID=UPI00384F514D
MFYRRKHYIIKNNFIKIFNDHFNETNFPNQLKHGSRLVGRWMRDQKDGTTEVFAIWEYDRYEDYIAIETDIKNDREHIARIKKWYELHGGRDHVLSEYILEVKNEALEDTVK